MGGQSGSRGYLLQSLICVLDLARDQKKWDTLTLEPDTVSEKVDICQTLNGKILAIQVRSSENQIGWADAKRWAEELEASTQAASYELWLIGPCSEMVCKAGQIGKVLIPTPHPLNIKGLIEQAAHQLDAYFEAKGISRVSPFVREIMVAAMVTKLSTYATAGTPLHHGDLDKLLSDWVLELYPPSINKAVEMQCSALWDQLVFPVEDMDLRSTLVVAPICFVNDGIRTAIIEDVAIEISNDDAVARFKGVMTVDLAQLQQEGINPRMLQFDRLFTEQAVSPGEMLKLDIIFVPSNDDDAKPMPALPGTYTCKLFALFAERDEPVLLRTRMWDLTRDLGPMFRGWNGKSFPTIRFRRRPIF